MKKVIFISFLFFALFLFSSFTLSNTSAAKGHKSSKAARLPVLYEGSFTYTTTFYLCNGHILDMTLTDNYKYRYSNLSNNNRYMLDGEGYLTGTGVDQTTGEVYTLNTTYSFHYTVPVSKGAGVTRSIFNESIIGNQNGKEMVNFASRLTYNAKGELTSEKTTITSICQ